MDSDRAHELIEDECERVRGLLTKSAAARAADLEAASDASTSVFDSASPLAQELVDDAVAEQLSARLAALDRASERLRAGTYGVSLHSGLPIPDERLEADPAAEHLVDEVAHDGTSATSSRRAAR
jgi:DnaK suppressor protein